MREQGRLAGEESGLVVHFKDFDFSSCGLGRILREEEHDLIYAVMKSFWLLRPEGELRRQEGFHLAIDGSSLGEDGQILWISEGTPD